MSVSTLYPCVSEDRRQGGQSQSVKRVFGCGSFKTKTHLSLQLTAPSLTEQRKGLLN